MIDTLRERQLQYLKIYSLAVSPYDDFIAGATNAGSVVIFKLRGGADRLSDEAALPIQELPVFSNAAYSLASTGHFLISGDSRGIIRAWRWVHVASKSLSPAFTINVADFTKSHRLLNSSYDINSMVTVGDHSTAVNHLYVGCGDSNIYSIDLSCGKFVRTLEGHKDFIHQMAFNDKKRFLYSCSEDGTIKIWDVDRTHQPIASVTPASRKNAGVCSGRWVGSVAVDASGDWLAFGGGVQMGIYNVPMAKFAATLEPTQLQAQAAMFVGDKLLFGGDSPSLYCYSVDGKMETEIPLGLSSIYAFETCLDNLITCVAGGGNKIELVRHLAYRAASLTVS